MQAPQVGLLHRVSVLALKLSKHLQTLEICLFQVFALLGDFVELSLPFELLLKLQIHFSDSIEALPKGRNLVGALPALIFQLGFEVRNHGLLLANPFLEVVVELNSLTICLHLSLQVLVFCFQATEIR